LKLENRLPFIIICLQGARNLRPESRDIRRARDDGRKKQERNPDPDRMEALRNLPKELVARLNREELDAFLFSDIWPDSLAEKLRDYQI